MIYGRAQEADQDSVEFQTTLKDYGAFLKRGMLEFEEARKAEADIDDLSGRVADVRGQGEGPGTVKELSGWFPLM